MTLFPISDSLTTIFGIIGTALTIITIIVMIAYTSATSNTEQDIEQGQSPQRIRHLSLFQKLIKMIKFILNPETHDTVRRHIAAITNFCNTIQSSLWKAKSLLGRGIPIRSGSFDFLLPRSSPRTADGDIAVEHELENMSDVGVMEDR